MPVNICPPFWLHRRHERNRGEWNATRVSVPDKLGINLHHYTVRVMSGHDLGEILVLLSRSGHSTKGRQTKAFIFKTQKENLSHLGIKPPLQRKAAVGGALLYVLGDTPKCGAVCQTHSIRDNCASWGPDQVHVTPDYYYYNQRKHVLQGGPASSRQCVSLHTGRHRLLLFFVILYQHKGGEVAEIVH